MKKASITLVAGIAILAGSTVHAQNIAIVNGKPILQSKYEGILATVKQQAEKSGRPMPSGFESRIKTKLIENTVLVQAAEQRRLNVTPEFRNKMEEARDAILITMLLDQFRKDHPVTDAMAKAEYDKLTGDQGNEYRARHILVKTDALAATVMAELKKGTSFDALARKYSQDPGSAKRGGDLDWSSARNYVPEFGKALSELKKGETTAAPVKTQFGYHIIRLDDTRKAAVPSFEQVKPQIVQKLENDQLMKYAQDLQSKARVQ